MERNIKESQKDLQTAVLCNLMERVTKLEEEKPNKTKKDKRQNSMLEQNNVEEQKPKNGKQETGKRKTNGGVVEKKKYKKNAF